VAFGLKTASLLRILRTPDSRRRWLRDRTLKVSMGAESPIELLSLISSAALASLVGDRGVTKPRQVGKVKLRLP
jgi:hypothetical protein